MQKALFSERSCPRISSKDASIDTGGPRDVTYHYSLSLPPRLQVAALSASQALEKRSHSLRLALTAATWNRKLRVGNRIGGPPENGEDVAGKVRRGHPVCERNENCFPAYLALTSRTSIRRNAEASFDETKKFNENGNRISLASTLHRSSRRIFV